MKNSTLQIKLKNFLKLVGKSIVTLYSSSLKFRIGFTLIIAIVAFSFISLATPPYHWRWYTLPKDRPPSLSSLDLLFGTTTNGRSVFWASTNAVANSLIIGLLTALVASHIGLLVGLLAGYKGGLVDKLLMFITDTFIVIPQLPLLIVLAMVLKRVINIPLMALLISITSWPWPARQVRAIVVGLREREFISTAILTGIPERQVIFKEIMPHVLGWHLINFTNTVLYAIGSEVGLSILGLSILHIDTLGTMIYWSMIGYPSLFRGIWWWVLPPIVLTIMIFVSLYLISTGIAETIEPRLRWRT